MKEKDTKKYGVVACFVAGLCVLLASLFFSKVDHPVLAKSLLNDFNRGWEVTTAQGAFDMRIDLPEHTSEVALGDSLILTNTLPEKVQDNTYLFFRASHQKVKVLLEGKEIYSFGEREDRLFGETPACAWILVPLASDMSGKEVTIQLTGVYSRYTNLVNAVTIGDKEAVVYDIVIKRFGSVFICLCLFIIGTGMIVVSIALRDRKTTDALRRLGILSVVVGSWSVCIINILQVFFPNVYVLLNFEFFFFNLILPVFLWFLFSFPHYREKKWMHVFFWASVVQFFLIEVLQLTGIADYMKSIVITHGLILVVIFTIIISGIKDIIRKKAAQEVNILVMSVVILLVFAAIDIARFYELNIEDEGFFSRIGTLLFICLWAVAVIQNMSRRLVTIAKTEALEELAYSDLMTGIRNRTAFEKWIEEYRPKEESDEVFLAIFDMNGLKEINDKHGHIKGDQALITIANLVKETFSSFGGTAYRIGGDEICVILPKENLKGPDNMDKLIRRIQTSVLDASINMNLVFTSAAGYSDVTLGLRNIMEAYREADRRMYANKTNMKKRNQEQNQTGAR